MPSKAWYAEIPVVVEKSRRAMWHGAGAHHGIFSMEKSSTQNGIIRPAILFLAWVTWLAAIVGLIWPAEQGF